MKMRLTVLGVGCLAAALALSACGSSGGGGNSSKSTSSNSSSSSTPAKSGGTLKVLEGTSPDSLDPDFGYTTQALEADDMVYVPMLTYAAKSGVAGTQLIPGLATALPTVSADGLTYTMTMRSGLKFSDGTPVVASDFAFGIQRSLKISWGGDSFFTQYIKGANDYATGKATSISGIVTDDTTGKITITLSQKYGAFDNLLAFESAAPLPKTTALKVLSNTPPVGIGPYKFGKIVPNASYTLVKNPDFASFKIPGVPAGNVDAVDVTVNSNTTAEAQAVLNNTADVFDAGDTIPSEVLPQVTSQASSRYQKEELASVYYFFMNTRVAPFNNLAARTAVNMALDRTALSKLSSGSLSPGCNFLPPTITGHTDGACSFGDPAVVPTAATLAKAKAMVASAGLAGTPVTVWSETRSPRQQYCLYLNDLLNKLGFKSSIKVIADAVYFQTIGKESTNPQIGFADWSQDFPNPSDFYLLLSKAAIQPTNNENFGDVDDPQIESQLASLESIPATQLSTVASKWAALDKYVADKSYVAPYGYETAPKFLSNRVNFDSAIFNPVEYIIFSTVSLK
ncbi:ABC transporter substrate-binding protein [Jatrophihabitans sp.]|uniref:ABC transporter substrate-binding protein n=1 Tax=Jatrophihabitans sp. TaxID=1932789 RepID=UPI0030C7361D|nr:extracellular solute-binding protein family 5 [Jatrophihabitans sp.]